MATPAQAKSLEAKALSAGTKSEGMRMLLENDYTIAQVRAIFGAPYGFVYGVASRAGLVISTPRVPKAAPAAKASKPVAAKPAAKAKVAPAPVRSKAAERAAARRAAVKAEAAKAAKTAARTARK